MSFQKKDWHSPEEMYVHIRELVAQFYGVDVTVVKADDDLHEHCGGKSEEYIDVWEFLGVLEEKFKIRIPIQEVETVKELADYLAVAVKKAPRSI